MAIKKRYRKIKPWSSTPFNKREAPPLWIVLVETQQDLIKYVGGEEPGSGSPLACFVHLDFRVGELVFCRQALDPNTITHESTHAALWVLKAERERHQLSIGMDEEPLAYLVGSITGLVCKFLGDVT